MPTLLLHWIGVQTGSCIVRDEILLHLLHAGGILHNYWKYPLTTIVGRALQIFDAGMETITNFYKACGENWRLKPEWQQPAKTIAPTFPDYQDESARTVREES